MRSRIILVILILCCVNSSVCMKRVKRIVGGMEAAAPPADDPVVFVRLFARNARVEGFRDKSTGLYSFLAIRYAEPPIGENRFTRPQYRRLAGDINATIYGPPCPQPLSNYPQTIIGEEDCLLLNVFTPQMPDESTGIPVLVFIHGGGFRYGSANQYGPDALTSQRVIFVPIQYRLGTLGMMGDGSTEFSGNVALFDMSAAIRWVNEYISFFGGDPKQINVIGHGSGAMSAMHLTTSRTSRDMISGVVAMSGTAFSKYAIDIDPQKSVKEVASVNFCPTTNETELIHCLRKRDFRDIINQDSKLQIERLQGENMIKSLTGMAGFSAVVEKSFDNRALPGMIDEEPKSKIESGTIKRIKLLTGVTKDETANAIPLKDIKNIWESANQFLEDLTQILDLESIVGNSGLSSIQLPGIGLPVTLSDYLKIPKTLDPREVLRKITEATTDALFNLPALMLAQTWSKIAPSFLYSFEFYGNESSGAKFLAGLPIVSMKNDTNTDEKYVSHGDELGYLFDLRDLYGNPLNSEYSDAASIKVRNSFTGLIAKFASLKETPAQQNNDFFSTITATGSSFIKIGEETSIENDFRFCQLSLWGARSEAAQSTSCAFLMNQFTSLEAIGTDLKKQIDTAVSKLQNPINILNKEDVVSSSNKNDKPSIFGLF